MKNRNRYIVILTLLIMTLLCACSVTEANIEFSATQNSIFIKHDGTIMSAIVEEAKGDTYTAEVLKTDVQAEADEFNKSGLGSTSTPVTVVSTKKDKDSLSVIFQYGDVKDMIAWGDYSQDDSLKINDIKIMSMSDTAAADVITGDFIDKAGKTADIDKIKSKTKYTTAVIDGPATVICEGKIEYVSAGVTVTDDNTAITKEGNNCIVFK